MDTITHIVLGGCTGEAIAGKRLGKKAMIIGACVNTIPDLDVVSNFWLDPDSSLLAHRGFTHSLAFVLLAGTLLSLLFRRWHRKTTAGFDFWFVFITFELFLHIFIDAFNSYGTGWFEPFSHYRVSFNTIFVADPFYTFWLALGFFALLVLRNHSERRRWWTRFGLGISSLYFMYCIVNKFKTDTDIRDMLQKQRMSYKRSFTTPAPLNNWLWYIVAANDSGYYIGYYSVFDSRREITLNYFPKNDSLLSPFRDQREVQHLVRFSKGYYTVEKWDSTIVFNDLRFGQIVGWYNPDEKFVFHYFLQQGRDNKMVVQRGRFAKWDLAVLKSLIKRVKGN